MEKNLLKPTGEIKELFTKHFQNLMQTYKIKNYLFVSDSRDGRSVIRGSPKTLSAMLIKELEGNAELQKIIVQFLRSSGMKKLFESEVKKHE